MGCLGYPIFRTIAVTLKKAAGEGHEGAKRALAVFIHRLARLIGGLATSLTLTGMPLFLRWLVRTRLYSSRATVANLGILGVTLDPAANERAIRGHEGVISRDRAWAVVVVPTNEEWMIAHDTRSVAHVPAQPTKGSVVYVIENIFFFQQLLAMPD